MKSSKVLKSSRISKRLIAIVSVFALILSLSVNSFALEKREKIESSEKFISECVTDEPGWLASEEETGEGLEDFYELTGVQPWLLLMDYDESIISEDDRVDFTENYYLDNFLVDDREDVYLFVCFNDADGAMSYTCSYAGDEAEKVMDDEATDILIDYIDTLWVEPISTDELFCRAFTLTAESLMSGKPAEYVPAEDDTAEAEEASSDEEENGDAAIDEDGSYNTKEEVALYIHTYGKLPSNYITKKEAEALGWSGGSLEPYAPGKSIGGSRFGNYEGVLPSEDGRVYTECDIDTAGKKSRGAKRIVFSNDGLIYYTEDHYETFELLYGEP